MYIFDLVRAFLERHEEDARLGDFYSAELMRRNCSSSFQIKCTQKHSKDLLCFHDISKHSYFLTLKNSISIQKILLVQ